MEYSISGKQIANALVATIGLAVATFLVKLYKHRRAMMGLVSNLSFGLPDILILALNSHAHLCVSMSIIIFVSRFLHSIIFLIFASQSCPFFPLSNILEIVVELRT